MSKFTEQEFKNRWKTVGYDIPNDANIRKFHKGYYKLIEQKINNLDQILGAFFATTQDRNGFSMGIFFACPDCFAYATMYPERDIAVLELFPYEKITKFAIATPEKKPVALMMNIYDKDVRILGYKHRIPHAFIKRLNEIGILKKA